MDRQKEMISTRPYCQIAGREISVEICLETQGQSGCFGCAAPTRFCEACKTRIVVIPATGLCSFCIVKGLAEEDEERFSHVVRNLKEVTCQIFKKSIRVEMCTATQGQEGCRNCPAPSRQCEGCKKRPVRFPFYGLCFLCTVATFGEGWKAPEMDENDEKTEIFPEDIFEPIKKKEDSMMHQEATSSETGTPEHGSGNGVIPDLCVRCRKQPSRYKKSGMCSSCYGVWYREERKKKGTPLSAKQNAQIRKLLPLAEDIMQKHKKVGAELFQKELQISYLTAQKLLAKLARKGHVIIRKGLMGRNSYRLSSVPDMVNHRPRGRQKKSTPITPRASLSTTAKIKTLQGLVETFGETSPAGMTLTAIIGDLKKFERVKKSFT